MIPLVQYHLYCTAKLTELVVNQRKRFSISYIIYLLHLPFAVIFKFFLIGGKLLYSAVLVNAVLVSAMQHKSAIIIHISSSS